VVKNNELEYERIEEDWKEGFTLTVCSRLAPSGGGAA